MKNLLIKNYKINKSYIKKAVINNTIDKTLSSIKKSFMLKKSKKVLILGSNESFSLEGMYF